MSGVFGLAGWHFCTSPPPTTPMRDPLPRGEGTPGPPSTSVVRSICPQSASLLVPQSRWLTVRSRLQPATPPPPPPRTPSPRSPAPSRGRRAATPSTSTTRAATRASRRRTRRLRSTRSSSRTSTCPRYVRHREEGDDSELSGGLTRGVCCRSYTRNTTSGARRGTKPVSWLNGVTG